MIIADSVLIERPDLQIGNDKTLPPDMESKIGKYPHQKLLKADPLIRVQGIRIIDGQAHYVEKGEKTARNGSLVFNNLNASFSNVTNDRDLIRMNSRCTAKVQASVFSTSPLEAQFIFYLDSTEGEFDLKGTVHNLTAPHLNAVAEPLSNMRINSLHIDLLAFQVHGDDFAGNGKVQMRYNDLAFVLRKTDEETGVTKTKKFLTKLINKFVIYRSNPSDGLERSANNVVYARTSSKSFFAVVWKTIFFGMQNIMLKSGRYQ